VQTVEATFPGNPTDPDVMECPYPFLENLRRDHPVYQVPDQGYFIVSRYADVKDVMRRHKDFSSDFTGLFGLGESFIPTPVFNLSDPPVHSRTKPVAMRYFGPKKVKSLQDEITKIADELIDKFADRGECEFIREFSMLLPITIIARQLGVAEEDFEKFKLWSDCMLVYNNPASTPEDIKKADVHVREANAYLMERFKERRANPKDDLISVLATGKTEVRGDDEEPRLLTDDEALGMMQLVLVGGNETTTNAIANGMQMLLERPEILANVLAGKVDWDPVIEEILRLEAPVRGFWRLAKHDTQVGGVDIPEGSLIFVSFASANRDEQEFEDAEKLCPARTNLQSHMTFGYGIHRCIGFLLARAEIQISYDRLFSRLKNLRLDEEKNTQKHKFVPTALVRGLKELHLKFDPEV